MELKVTEAKKSPSEDKSTAEYRFGTTLEQRFIVESNGVVFMETVDPTGRQ